MNRLKESNYRRRITHTHSTQTRARTLTYTHTHTIRRRRRLAGFYERKNTVAHGHTNTHTHARARGSDSFHSRTHCTVHQSTVLQRARTVSAHKFLSFIDQSAALLQPATAAACPATSLPPTRSVQLPGTFFLLFTYTRSRTHVYRSLAHSFARAETDSFSFITAAAAAVVLSPGVSLALSLVPSSRSPPLPIPPSLFARGQQVKTCTDPRTADAAAARMISRQSRLLFATAAVR